MSFEASIPQARRGAPGLGNFNVWHYLALLIVGVLVGLPLAFLILGSLSAARLPTEFSLSKLTLAQYAGVYLDPFTYSLLGNTLIYTAGSVLTGSAIAVMLAWLVERTNVPWKTFIYAGVPITLAVPGMLQSMAWVLIASPRIGIMNRWMMAPGQEIGPINIYSMWGMIFVQALRLVPTAFLMLVPLMRGMDPSLEEAALAAGATPFSMLRKVTARLLAPGLFAVMIYQGMTALEVFEVPGILGMPANIYVFSTRIYSIVQTSTFTPEYGQANALAIVFLLIAVVTTFFYARLIGRAERYTVITGKGYRPRRFDLGRWRYLGFAAALAYIFLATILPFAVFVFTSFLPFLQAPTLDIVGNLTLKHYQSLLLGDFQLAMTNTFMMVIATATAVTVLSFFTSLVIVRSRFWGRKLLDQLAFTPHAIPGIVMGLSFFWIFARIEWLPFYGNIWSMCIAFTTLFLAYGTRSMNASLLQIHKELEEAAHVSGARPWRTLLKIFLPLMLPTFAGVWIWSILQSMNIASLPLMLYQGSENQVLSIFLWGLWNTGYTSRVAAVGTIMIATLSLVTLIVRVASFRRAGA